MKIEMDREMIRNMIDNAYAFGNNENNAIRNLGNAANLIYGTDGHGERAKTFTRMGLKVMEALREVCYASLIPAVMCDFSSFLCFEEDPEKLMEGMVAWYEYANGERDEYPPTFFRQVD